MNTINKFIFFALFYISISANSYQLSNLAVLQRCYLQLTGSRLSNSSNLYLEVKNQNKDPIDICFAVLGSANLTEENNNKYLSSNNAELVFQNFHNLHASWFKSKDFPVISWDGHNYDTKSLYDTTIPALYLTRALFTPNMNVRNILTTSDFLIPIRTNMNPEFGPGITHYKMKKTNYIFKLDQNNADSFSFAATGKLLGIKSVSAKFLNYDTFTYGVTSAAGSIDIYSTLGGGFLGTQPYLLLNISSLPSNEKYKTDGAVKMFRKWGQAVIKDTLCRELPVVREQDIVNMVDQNSTVPFRTSTSCTKCHASHDRISSVIRNGYVKYLGIGDQFNENDLRRGGNFIQLHNVDTSLNESEWSLSADSNFYKRKPTGVLYFRNYKSELIDIKINNIEELGQKITEQDDFYICLARKYYSYFIGIDVDTGDINDPTRFQVLSTKDLEHRNIVIQLGLKLKSDQSLSQLVRNIMQLKHYKNSDFEIQ